MAENDETATVDLGISLEKVCYLIVKAREFDVKVEVVEPDPGSNPTDDQARLVLEDHDDDPTYWELMAALRALNDDESIAVVALVWLGRGDFRIEDWKEALELARERHNERTAEYLAGTPLLGDYLEEGIAQFGLSCETFEIDRF